jgi:hypothetical protein
MDTYLTNDDLFILVPIPFSYGFRSITTWFETNHKSSYRLISDDEAITEFLNLEQLSNFYYGVKSISIVMNPWAKMKFTYDMFIESMSKGIRNNFKIYFDYVELSNFKKFVMSLNKQKIKNRWFNTSTPQLEWISYKKGEDTIISDFILKAETLEEDFFPIKQYFQSENIPLLNLPEYPDYRKHYDSEMIEKISSIFSKDIEYFGYTF